MKILKNLAQLDVQEIDTTTQKQIQGGGFRDGLTVWMGFVGYGCGAFGGAVVGAGAGLVLGGPVGFAAGLYAGTVTGGVVGAAGGTALGYGAGTLIGAN